VKQRHLQYLGPVNIDSKITEIESVLQTSEFQEKEMQKRADWNQEGEREMYESEVKREQEEQTRLKKKLVVYERHQKKLGTTSKTNFKHDFQQEYDSMHTERRGSMVRIPDLWKKMEKKGYSRKEFEKELFAMEKKREIELQTASDPKLVKDKKDAIDHPSRGLITYVVWRRPTSTSKKSKKKQKKRARRKHDKYECGVCGKQFQSKQTLSWHFKDNHPYVGSTLSKEEKMIELEEWH